MYGFPFVEQILATIPRYTQDCRNKTPFMIKHDIFYSQYYNDVGYISHLLASLPVQLKDTLLNSLHGQTGKHPDISKMMQEIRQKNYFHHFPTNRQMGKKVRPAFKTREWTTHKLHPKKNQYK